MKWKGLKKKKRRRGNALMGQAHVLGFNQKTQDRT
jgi:hypothetical protein